MNGLVCRLTKAVGEWDFEKLQELSLVAVD